MLKRLYDIAALFKEYFLFAFLVVVSLVLLSLNDNAQIQTLRSRAVATVGFAQGVLTIIPNYFDLLRENRALREFNLTLSDEVSRLREARLENLRLHNLLGLKQKPRFGTIAANVVGKTLQLLRNTITLDVGEKDGVMVNMAVVTEEGLVGKIIATSSHYAVGQILLNRDLRVSAKVQRSRVDGIIRWDGGRMLGLQNVVKTMDVRSGDLIITSEYSTVFPPGIPIGIVSSARLLSESLFQSIEVAPSVDFTRIEEVFIVASPPDTSRSAAESRAKVEGR
jgi:rod shape-determining protein MreC